jgi:hypothetical protein
MAAAAIEEIRKTPKRASSQLAKFNDVDSMQKSKKREAWKSLDFSGGNSSALSFMPRLVPPLRAHRMFNIYA